MGGGGGASVRYEFFAICNLLFLLVRLHGTNNHRQEKAGVTAFVLRVKTRAVGGIMMRPKLVLTGPGRPSVNHPATANEPVIVRRPISSDSNTRSDATSPKPYGNKSKKKRKKDFGF